MAKRYRMSRSRFYGLMSAVPMGVAGLNFLLGALMMKLAGNERAGGFLTPGLVLVLLLSPALYLDDRRNSCCLSKMIGCYVSYVMVFCLQMVLLWEYVHVLWLLPAFALENLLYWRYFARHKPNPL